MANAPQSLKRAVAFADCVVIAGRHSGIGLAEMLITGQRYDMNAETFPAVILAGGRATRMGGGAKDARVLAGKTLLEHVLARISPQCEPVAVNANADRAEYAAHGLPVLPDSIPGQLGPLAGILAAMDWAAEHGHRQVLTVPTDTPFLPDDLMPRLIDLAGEHGLCLAASAGRGEDIRSHPTCGLWPIHLRDDLRAALLSGKRKVMGFAHNHDPAFAVWDY